MAGPKPDRGPSQARAGPSWAETKPTKLEAASVAKPNQQKEWEGEEYCEYGVLRPSTLEHTIHIHRPYDGITRPPLLFTLEIFIF